MWSSLLCHYSQLTFKELMYQNCTLSNSYTDRIKTHEYSAIIWVTVVQRNSSGCEKNQAMYLYTHNLCTEQIQGYVHQCSCFSHLDPQNNSGITLPERMLETTLPLTSENAVRHRNLLQFDTTIKNLYYTW